MCVRDNNQAIKQTFASLLCLVIKQLSYPSRTSTHILLHLSPFAAASAVAAPSFGYCSASERATPSSGRPTAAQTHNSGESTRLKGRNTCKHVKTALMLELVLGRGFAADRCYRQPWREHCVLPVAPRTFGEQHEIIVNNTARENVFVSDTCDLSVHSVLMATTCNV